MRPSAPVGALATDIGSAAAPLNRGDDPNLEPGTLMLIKDKRCVAPLNAAH